MLPQSHRSHNQNQTKHRPWQTNFEHNICLKQIIIGGKTFLMVDTPYESRLLQPHWAQCAQSWILRSLLRWDFRSIYCPDHLFRPTCWADPLHLSCQLWFWGFWVTLFRCWGWWRRWRGYERCYWETSSFCCQPQLAAGQFHEMPHIWQYVSKLKKVLLF